jgi:hypothetical protein
VADAILGRAFHDDCRSKAALAGATESRSSKTAAGASGELSGGVLPRASGRHGEESGYYKLNIVIN